MLRPTFNPISLSKTPLFKEAWHRWTFTKAQSRRLFEEFKARLSIYRVFEHLGGNLYRGAIPQATYCVLHYDNKRSAKITDDHYVCYAGCGSGDVIWVLGKAWDIRSLQGIIKKANQEFSLGLLDDPTVGAAVLAQTDDGAVEVKTEKHATLDTMKVHRVYQALLERLTLLKRHREELAGKRLLPERVIDALEAKGYRSYKECWGSRFLKLLDFDLLGEEFYGVPGFYQEDGRWRFAAPDGVLFPVVDINGTIRALSVRKDEEGNGKYVYVSSAGRQQGTRSWYGVHVIRHGKSFKNIWVVEGILKADVVSQFLPESGAGLILGIPSMTVGHKDLSEICKEFPKSNIILAIDSDWRDKSTVKNGLMELVGKLQQKLPNKLALASWDPRCGKGLDDVLAAGHFDALKIKPVV